MAASFMSLAPAALQATLRTDFVAAGAFLMLAYF
jgi:hypothetical protein